LDVAEQLRKDSKILALVRQAAQAKSKSLAPKSMYSNLQQVSDKQEEDVKNVGSATKKVIGRVATIDNDSFCSTPNHLLLSKGNERFSPFLCSDLIDIDDQETPNKTEFRISSRLSTEISPSAAGDPPEPNMGQYNQHDLCSNVTNKLSSRIESSTVTDDNSLRCVDFSPSLEAYSPSKAMPSTPESMAPYNRLHSTHNYAHVSPNPSAAACVLTDLDNLYMTPIAPSLHSLGHIVLPVVE